VTADGDPAPDGDLWYRILTSDKHITKGRIQHAAFKGRFLNPPPPERNRPWTAEASGRLRSLAGTIEAVDAHCKSYCHQFSGKFCGIIFPKEQLAGQMIENLEVGIYYTPSFSGDQAHAALTFTGNVPVEKTAEYDKFIMELSKRFTAIHPDQLNLLPEANLAKEPHITMIEAFKASMLAAYHKLRG
jgi:hypothetical protein